MKLIESTLYCLLLIGGASGIVPGTDSHYEQASSKTSELELPSFSIFGLPLSDNPHEMNSLLDPATLDGFLARVQDDRAKDGVEERDYFWIIPMIFYESRDLFEKDSWTGEEVRQGQLIATFFAQIAKRPDLSIIEPDRDSFREGLARLRNWFVSLCQDNRALASMIFTLDSGPFFGREFDIKHLPAIKVVGSITIPGEQAKFALMRDEREQGGIIMGVINQDKSLRWIRKFSAARGGRIVATLFEDSNAVKLQGYGYILRLTAQLHSRKGRCLLYLDDALNLRFYFLSW